MAFLRRFLIQGPSRVKSGIGVSGSAQLRTHMTGA